ncbi:MAG: hypothetical protein ABI178_02935 [Rhodanobacter sp.]
MVALGLVAVFAVVIIVTLRLATRAQTRNLGSVTAVRVWSELGHGDVPDPGLLYGTWQTFAHEVVLAVKDADDRVIGRVTQRGLGGLDTVIVIGPVTFRVVPQRHWREAADLVTNDPDTGRARVVCSFAKGAHRLATYTCEDGRMLSIPSGWDWPWRRRVSNILCLEKTIGSIWTPGSPWLNQGRALVLPVEIPPAVRLFVLWKGSGLNTRANTR